ncbi:MAG: zinc-ribbon domain-containing protein [Gemmatimonadota bacterium]
MVITVQCPSCAESFPVDTNKVPVGGVNARCSLCSTIFRVERPEETIPPPQRPEVEAAAEVPASPDVVGAPEVDAGSETEVAAGPEPEVEAVFDVEAEPEPELEPEPVIEAEPEPELEPEPVIEAEVEQEPEVEPVAEAAPEREPETEPEMRQESEPEAEPALEPPADGAAEESADEGGSPAVPEIEDWVFETGPEVRFEELDIPPASSVNRSTARARPEVPSAETDEQETRGSFADEPDSAGALEAVHETSEPAPTEDSHVEEDPSAAPKGFIMGKRDPREKAQRLARVLVSDMIMYNPERHQQALANETLEEDFADEITKSWAEYVDQVGEDLANGTPFWSDALNDILAKGQKIF